MANAFNIDKGGNTTSDTHLINETFHVFSKSPGSPTTSLGGARLKSGHTTTASDVWADEIPAFFKAATQAKFDLFSTKAVKDDLCLFNGNVYQHNGTQFVSLGTEAEVLVDGATFKKNNKDVVKYHKNRTAINLTADNNNGDGSNNYTAKIYNAATGSTTFVPQFISAMDKMVDGVPSLAYDAAVFAGGSQLAEGLTADNDYICNAYAGVIQFNKARTQDTVTVSAWEYIGTKLNSELAKISAAVFGSNTPGEGEEDLSLSEQVTANTTAINILNGGDAVEGSIAHSIKTAIDALGDVAVKSDIKISEIKVKSGSTTTTLTPDSNKSVTVEIPEVQAATTSVAGVVTISDNDAIAIDETSTAAATVAAVAATRSAIADELGALAGTVSSNKTEVDGKISAIEGKLASTGEIGQAIADVKATADSAVQSVTKASGSSDLLTVTDGTNATISLSTEVATKSDITTEINKLSAADGVITTLTTRVGEAEANAAASASAASASEAAAKSAQSAAETAESNASASKTAAEAAQAAAESAQGEAATSASAAQAAQSAAEGSATSASQSASAASAAQSAAEAAQAAAEAAQAVVETTADWQAGTEDTLGDFTSATASGVVTGTTVKTVADEVLTLAKAYSDSLHTTSLDYVVLGDSETLPTASADTLGKIYLVKEGNTANGETDIDAISGSYVEYMTRKVGEGETATYTWEKIGTTAADLSGYAKSVKINGTTYTASAANAGALDLGTVVREVQWDNATADHVANGSNSTYATVSSNGTLTLGIASATSDKKGISKMFTSDITPGGHTNVTDTAASLHSTAKMYGILSSSLDLKANKTDVVTSVSDSAYCYLAGINITSTNDSSGIDVTVKHGLIGSATHMLPFNQNYDMGGERFIKVNGNVATLQEGSQSIIEVEICPEKFVDGCVFSNGTKLESWSSDMPNLTDGENMFENCANLATFCGDLSSVTNGYHMFYLDTALTSFCGDLSSLTGGGGMFTDCKLDAESLECIADTINDVRSLTPSTQVTKLINIGYNCSAADAQAAYDTITGKGWSCIMTYKA